MQHLTVRGKAGGGYPSPNEVGFCDFVEMTVPFKTGSLIQERKYLIGWFLNQLNESPTASTEDGDHGVFVNELYAIPIREGLASW
jgi:hypothetical protein